MEEEFKNYIIDNKINAEQFYNFIVNYIDFEDMNVSILPTEDRYFFRIRYYKLFYKFNYVFVFGSDPANNQLTQIRFSCSNNPIEKIFKEFKSYVSNLTFI